MDFFDTILNSIFRVLYDEHILFWGYIDISRVKLMSEVDNYQAATSVAKYKTQSQNIRHKKIGVKSKMNTEDHRSVGWIFHYLFVDFSSKIVKYCQDTPFKLLFRGQIVQRNSSSLVLRDGQ